MERGAITTHAKGIGMKVALEAYRLSLGSEFECINQTLFLEEESDVQH